MGANTQDAAAVRLRSTCAFPFLICLIFFISSLVTLWRNLPRRRIFNTGSPSSHSCSLYTIPILTTSAVGYVKSCIGPCRNRVTLCLTFLAKLCCITGKTALTETCCTLADAARSSSVLLSPCCSVHLLLLLCFIPLLLPTALAGAWRTIKPSPLHRVLVPKHANYSVCLTWASCSSLLNNVS